MSHSILVVDDEKNNLQIILNYLEEAKQEYSIISAPNGRIACKLALNKHPDLILLDWVMPEMDGLEALKYIKSQDKTKEIPVLMVTGQTASEDLEEAMGAGAMDYIRKPIDKIELLARVKSAIALYDSFKQIKKQKEEIAKEKEKVEHFANELENRNQELREFTSVASHDLKEPLRKVITLADRLKEAVGNKLDEKPREYLDRIRVTTKRMNQLIEDLLKYSKISVNETPVEKTDLSEILKDVLTDLEVSIEESKGKVNIHDLPTVDADKTQMHQLFQNLLSNALKFHQKGASPKVNISSRVVNQEFYEITVEDNGLGFDEKNMDKLFKPFQRLHDQKDFEGTGIGAAICQKIVKKHGGEIRAESTPGKGATFTILLPARQKKAD
ncbi:response regulator [Candidatus Amoebophilus asiaticus]|nr:response regulator [Candidatus Amoebophilus asiaticus]